MNDITEKHLDQQLRVLPQGLLPERDLWPDIQASIRPVVTESRGSRFDRFYPLAAAAVLLVFVSSGLNFLNEEGGAPVLSQQSSELGNGGLLNTSFNSSASGQRISAGYEQVRDELERDLVSRLESLSPKEKVVIEQNIKKIDAALAEINAALKADPSNMLLQRLLISAYSDDLALFGEINSMTRNLDERVQL